MAISDESVLKFYENIRQQVAADMRLRSKHRLLGEAAKREALRLEEELNRRGVPYTPISWS